MPRINLIHAALDAGNVDICLDGSIVLADLAYGDYANFSRFAGCCYGRLEVKATGTSTVLVCVPCFTFPCEGDFTLVVHWNLAGDEATITCYDNVCTGKGNFIFRHAAGVGKVNVCKTDVNPPIQAYTNVCQGDDTDALYFPEGTNNLLIKLASDDSELATVEFEIAKNTLNIVYLTGKTGSPDEFDTVTEVIALPPPCLTYWCGVYRGHCSTSC